METIPNEILVQIIQRVPARDQLTTLRMINNRFYHLSPVDRFRRLDVDNLLSISPIIQSNLSSYWSRDEGSDEIVIPAYNALIDYIGKINGKKLKKIRFTSNLPINTELFDTLSINCPKLTELDLTMNYDREVILPLGPLTALPKFSSLQTLRLNYHIDSNFAPVLAKLRLRRLEIGGLDAPITTADNSILEELTLLSPDPLSYMEDTVYRLGDEYPNLMTHQMKDFFGGYSILPNDFDAKGGRDNYRRLSNLRGSDYIDGYFGRFLSPRFSIDFPNLRRIDLLNCISFAHTTATLEPAFDTFRQLTDLSFRVTPSNREFFISVLTSNRHLRKLRIEIPFGRGSYLLVRDLSPDTMPFRSQLRVLCIQGYDGISLFAKFWYTCPNLKKVKLVDQSILRREDVVDFWSARTAFQGRPKLEKLIINCDVSVQLLEIMACNGRLKNIGRLTFNIHRPMNPDVISRLMNPIPFPLLRRLDIVFPTDWNGSIDIARHVILSFPRLRSLSLINLRYNHNAKRIWGAIGGHIDLERLTLNVSCSKKAGANMMDEVGDLSIPRRDRLEDNSYSLPWLKIQVYGSGLDELVYTCADARCCVSHKGRKQLDFEALYGWL